MTDLIGRAESVVLPIDERRLMQIAVDLPRLELNQETEEGMAEALGIFIQMDEALRRYLAAVDYSRKRPTVGTARSSLRRLDSALTDLEKAWTSADLRTQNYIFWAMGNAPNEGVERLPRPADRWTRGAQRVVKAREGAANMAAAVSRLKRAFDSAKQDRGHRAPGVVELTEGLADLFERYKGRPFSTSRNLDNAADFVRLVASVLPASLRPGSGSITNAVWHVTNARKKAALGS